MNKTADLITEMELRVKAYDPILRKLGFEEDKHPSLPQAGGMTWYKDLDVGKYDASRAVVVFESDGSITIGAGDKARPSDYSWHYRSLTPARLQSTITESLWEVEKEKKVAMNKIVASELLKVAKELAGAEMVAASGDLAEIRAIIPETRKAQAEQAKKMEEFRQITNQMWAEATRELHDKIRELLNDSKEELIEYFNSTGRGVRSASGGTGDSALVEVFLGSNDGVKRYQSKVSVFVALTFEGRERATFMMRNENGDETVELTLSDKNTIAKMMQEVKKADKKGFWSAPEVE